MEIAIEYGHEEEQTKINQELLELRCSWGLEGQRLVGEGDGRSWRLRARAVVCDWAE